MYKENMYYETVGQKHDIKDLKFKKEKKNQ